MTDSPQLLVVGGPNGSGKTTAALEYATETGLPFVSADVIAASVNPASPATARIVAGRQFVQIVDQRISSRTPFIVESTLSGVSFQHSLRKAIQAGFEVTIAFLFVDSAETCITRVAERVRKGGHDIPEPDIRRRYFRSVNNFWTIYRDLADNWVLLYNGDVHLQDIAVGSREQIAIRDADLYASFLAIVEPNND